MNDRRGFTLVELMMVALLGSVVVMAAYNVLITNQQTYRVQNSKAQAQQSTRAAMDVLFNELREVSSAGGDIVDFGDDFLEVKAMRTVGLVCEADMSLFGVNPILRVRKVLNDFEAGDSVVIFADNDEYRTSDDTWIKGLVTSIDTTAVCTDLDGVDYEAARMAFTGQTATFLADSVRVGAPIRSYVLYEYGLMSFDGQEYLGRSEDGGDWVPLVGPLSGAGGQPGLGFEYFDAAGNTATTVGDIERVAVTLRSYPGASDPKGTPIVDSLSASIYMRN
ncbi:MAG: prepilin-type N-terminal cleavage/methylation domain-containing protein [Gemmatimonadota bacterium]